MTVKVFFFIEVFIGGHYRTETNADAGLLRRTNGKTNDAGLTFFRQFYSRDPPIFLEFQLIKYT
jgi:hypothetical protein